jgi:hypothetical protein
MRSPSIALPIDGQVNTMLPRIPRVPGLPFGGGVNVLLVGGAAYFAWEHEQGRHKRPHVLCPVCWLNRIAPPAEPSSGTGPAAPPEQP